MGVDEGGLQVMIEVILLLYGKYSPVAPTALVIHAILHL